MIPIIKINVGIQVVLSEENLYCRKNIDIEHTRNPPLTVLIRARMSVREVWSISFHSMEIASLW